MTCAYGIAVLEFLIHVSVLSRHLGWYMSRASAMILRRALLLLLLGLSVGVVLAFSTSRVLRSYLYGVREHDLVTTVAVSLLLCGCGVLAAYLPARRAASVDPIEALRTE